MFDKSEKDEEPCVDFNAEVTACFESMLFPNRYLYQDVNLLSEKSEALASRRKQKDWVASTFDYPTPAASGNISCRSTSGSDSSRIEDFEEGSDDSLGIKEAVNALNIGSSPLKQRSYSLSSFKREVGLPRRLSFDKSDFLDGSWSNPWNQELSKEIKAIPNDHQRGGRSAEADIYSSNAILEGRVSFHTKSQKGCRFLQKLLQEGTAEQYLTIFKECVPIFCTLSVDPFGNYVAQRLYEVSDHSNRRLLLKTLEPHIRSIAFNNHGTRALQKIVECSVSESKEEASLLISCLERKICDLCLDVNGNHVVQKLLGMIKPPLNQFIYDELSVAISSVSTDRHGCCVLQRALDYATVHQQQVLATKIIHNSLSLIQDPFGNYVVQYVLDLANPDFTSSIVHELCGHICHLSKQKFSSNAIEKIIRVASPSDRLIMINELMKNGNVESMVCDSYANYVIQTCIDFADPIQRRQLINHVIPKIMEIRHSSFAKKLICKIQFAEPGFSLDK